LIVHGTGFTGPSILQQATPHVCLSPHAGLSACVRADTCDAISGALLCSSCSVVVSAVYAWRSGSTGYPMNPGNWKIVVWRNKIIAN